MVCPHQAIAVNGGTGQAFCPPGVPNPPGGQSDGEPGSPGRSPALSLICVQLSIRSLWASVSPSVPWRQQCSLCFQAGQVPEPQPTAHRRVCFANLEDPNHPGFQMSLWTPSRPQTLDERRRLGAWRTKESVSKQRPLTR